MRDTIFISHATPQDNEFSIWLASRLEMLGYKVWLDKDHLLGGESFWDTIQKALNQSCKVLLVYSNNIVDADGLMKGGIQKEFYYAESISKKERINDFIIPLHIDNSPYDLVIGMPNINHILFAGDWAEGLKILLKKLSDDGVPKVSNGVSSFKGWYENYISDIHVHKYPQTYFSTWVKFDKLPDTFYIYHFNSTEDAEKVKELNHKFPTAVITNSIITFERELDLNIYPEDKLFLSKPQEPEIYEVKISELDDNPMQGTEVYPSNRDKVNAFKKLMKTIWSYIMCNAGMNKYEMSSRTFAFFRPVQGTKHHQYEFDKGKNGRPKKKAITGKQKQYIWHYALSANVTLTPVVGYEVKYHIIFSEDGIIPIEDHKKQHQLRRSKGAMMFNKEWRDLLRAFLKALCNSSGKIGCFVGYVTVPEGHDFEDDMYIELSSVPVVFTSEYDYKEPQKEMSGDSVDNYVNEENIDEADD